MTTATLWNCRCRATESSKSEGSLSCLLKLDNSFAKLRLSPIDKVSGMNAFAFEKELFILEKLISPSTSMKFPYVAPFNASRARDWFS
mmetsp:Transcript_203/g.324  ORF Transcript_203/g.324 Transcript_203/m.324 type:complete len:88 (-) Transcript_203:777-1040(-)